MSQHNSHGTRGTQYDIDKQRIDVLYARQTRRHTYGECDENRKKNYNQTLRWMRSCSAVRGLECDRKSVHFRFHISSRIYTCCAYSGSCNRTTYSVLEHHHVYVAQATLSFPFISFLFDVDARRWRRSEKKCYYSFWRSAFFSPFLIRCVSPACVFFSFFNQLCSFCVENAIKRTKTPDDGLLLSRASNLDMGLN